MKKGSPQQKKDIAGSVKPGKPPARKYGFICPAGRVGAGRKKIILPGLPAVGDGLSHLWAGSHMQLSATGSKKQQKKKISENP